MDGKNGKSITIDRGHNIPMYSPVCTYCKHFIIEAGKRSCKAFPDGIPLEIWLGLNRHVNSYPGDRNIQFERLNK
jgi:hypothetical protein